VGQSSATAIGARSVERFGAGVGSTVNQVPRLFSPAFFALGFFVAAVVFFAVLGRAAFFLDLFAKILSQLSENLSDDPVWTV
jgi:hypothetical protein